MRLSVDGLYIYCYIRGRHGDRTIEGSTASISSHQLLGLVFVDSGELEIHVHLVED